MGYLLPALTDAKFENQRNVVLNERRQNYENRPYGFAGMSLVAALYPPDHPYHWMTIGAAEDLKAAQLDDVRAFFQTYYRPRNASLAIAGDIDAGPRARAGGRLLRRVSTRVRSRPRSRVATCRSRRETRLVLEDRIELPRLYLAWHSPALFAEDDAELDLVSEVLAGGKTSRLYRSLVYEQRIATEVAASQGSRELGSFFQIVATAAPGRTLAEVEQAIARELARFLEEGPSAGELERCLAQAEAHFLHRLQTVGGFGGKSDQLNAYNVYLGDARVLRPGPGALSTRRRRQPAACGGALARRRARRAERRAARPRDAGARGLTAGLGVLMAVDRSRLPLSGPEPHFAFPEIRRTTTLERSRRVDGRASRGAAPLRAGADSRRGRVRPDRPPGARGHHRRSPRRRLRRPRCAGPARDARAARGAARYRGGSRCDARRPHRRSSGPRRQRWRCSRR